MKPIGITLGEPTGIGPELVVRSLASMTPKDARFLIYGSPALLERTALDLGIRPFWNQEKIALRPIDTNPNTGVFLAKNVEARAKATLEMLDAAAEDARNGLIAALVTAPIDKSVVRTLLPEFTGHTEYLAEKAAVRKTVMMLDNGEIRVVLLTNHVALRDVYRELSSQGLEEIVRIVSQALRQRFGISNPRFALAGVNPHAGEIVKDSEEEEIFAPAVSKLKREGIFIEGPFAADSLFAKARGGMWDVVLSPYHDQGLVAAKYSGLQRVVNITLGLPYLRISPGHGVAYDIAGKGVADTRSFERALRIAQTEELES
jgi:4-hydroxythreonine-4-phosphate dehydrogenase